MEGNQIVQFSLLNEFAKCAKFSTVTDKFESDVFVGILRDVSNHRDDILEVLPLDNRSYKSDYATFVSLALVCEKRLGNAVRNYQNPIRVYSCKSDDLGFQALAYRDDKIGLS